MMVGGMSACALYRYSAPYTRAVNLVVPVREIAPYTIVTPDMVQVRAFPEAMAQEQVYRSVDEVIGNVATTTLIPGQLIYVQQLAAPQQFYLTRDDELEVVSFPVKPEQAVGAHLRIGQRVNVYHPTARASAIGTELTVSDIRAARDGYVVLTLAAPPDIVREILQSGADTRDALWVTLAPRQSNVMAQR
jgi:pilus assembly protein CpaB